MSERELVQLPNKDLWRGYVHEGPQREDTLTGATPSKIDSAMEKCLKASTTGSREITCVWCGQQGDEKFIREHLKDSHQSALGLKVADEASILSAALAEAKSQLAELTNKE